ncbi:DUF4179 domain-containing protein [Sporosarcina highlanderae]|uniref:DUF4179 domain-containing protein n=1 Tax=Sporosarcina highlanderae TaxID=3035916 RepID=A0ABT8JPG0_9BACL|nr:DUF4179 domain-containing protein [Sporosarcina highlanderae]MDN4607029.1 DUF4179 domain-containing protein [Sporosarcina highlanderae]
MSMKDWIDMDIDQLVLLDVTDIEKARVKQHILKKHKKAPIWRDIAVAAVIIGGASTATGFAFPSLAAQIPFMNNVINYFDDEEQRYKNFEAYSTDIDLSQTSNGITVMIDNAVYDGTNITVSFAIETDHDFGETMRISAPNWFGVVGASGSGGSSDITKISDRRYVGLSTFRPHFKNDQYPETVEITWSPQAFNSMSNDLEIRGNWSFGFSLDRLEGDIQLVNETVQSKDVKFTLKSVEFTDVSTVIAYEQVVTDELLEQWPSITPVFQVTDDLGHVYMDGGGGGGVSTNNGKNFKGTTTFGTIHEGASQLFIQPVEIASLMSGQGHTEIKLDPIVIELKK